MGDYDQLKVPAGVSGPITPAIEAQLNERQKQLGVVRDTANRDLTGLVQLGLLEPVGKGRGARYELKNPSP